jgi:hypothetical protein
MVPEGVAALVIVYRFAQLTLAAFTSRQILQSQFELVPGFVNLLLSEGVALESDQHLAVSVF